MKTSPVSSVSHLAIADARFRVIGVGGAGGRLVEHLAQAGLDGVGFAALNTDTGSLEGVGAGWRLQLGERLTRGLGAGGDPEVGRAAALESAAGIQEICRGAELVFVVAGLGGGTGTGAAPVVARLAREAGALVLALVTTPFQCEGARRQRQAVKGLEELREAADAVLCLPNQRVLGLIDENTSLVETFRYTEELLAQGLRGIWRLAGRPGLINVDFADLRELLKDRHAESFFACAEASGEQRTREVVEQLMMSPLLENGALLREASGALVSVVAGPGLTMAEINWVIERLQRECEGAEILLGATVEPAYDDRLSITFIGARRAATENQDPTPEEPTQALQAPPRIALPESEGVETDFFRRQPAARRSRSKYVPPAPEMTPAQQRQAVAKSLRNKVRMQQAMLPLEIVSKGRFEKSEPTLYRGEDLDVPTFVRRGMVLN